MNIFNTPTTKLKGVGKKRAETLSKLGIDYVYDVINFLPLYYEDRRAFSFIEDLNDGDEVCLKATVKTSVKTIRVRSNLIISNCIIFDETGEIMIVWYNQRFVEKQLVKGNQYNFFGKVKKGKSRLEFINPTFESIDIKGYTGRIVPVYPLLSKIPQKIFSSIVREALLYSENILVNTIPKCVEEKYCIPDLTNSMKNVHFPENENQVADGRKRFAFEEFFYFQTLLTYIRKNSYDLGAKFENLQTDLLEKKLPFSLTPAQKKVIQEIKNDLSSGRKMNRLLQGDVGSGKTIVSIIASSLAKLNGFCSVVLVPTEILAKQHYSNFSEFLPGCKISLLTSSCSGANKMQIYNDIKSGNVDVLIGTHAVLEDPVEFKNLGLVIIDEQHRFGVRQRQKLLEKGINPHLLVMTATPIPRTLSLIMYNDLDISVIDSLPQGRKPIKTYLVGESYRERIYTFLQKEISSGGQAYIICPLVEECECMDLKDVTSFATELKRKIPNLKMI